MLILLTRFYQKRGVSRDGQNPRSLGYCDERADARKNTRVRRRLPYSVFIRIPHGPPKNAIAGLSPEILEACRRAGY